ncbi:universal stress protein [Rhodohalobacter sp. 614A]|uniref:universal stress protein n=1 Tax=Rhodohalobacter sp. 614A TaxID=2908649 RepID=UPI001F175FC5|nr:universal stress protein [Rhodohalobacter sp. 614A]
MINFKKILVPTDFSSGSEIAYSVAQNIADTFGGVIDFIHVVPTITYLNESIKRLGVPLDMEKDIYPKIIEESEVKLEKAMDQYLKEKSKGKHIVKINRRPSYAISEYAKKHDYDMIVIGSRGKDETKFIRGGTTERVIRRSHVPVFSVDDRFDKSKVKNVLMTTDSSEMSLVAFPLAVAIADAFDARLSLMHVVELYGSLSEEIPKSPKKGELVSIYEGIIERINHYLTKKGFDSIHVQRTGVTYEDEVIITDGENSRSIQLSTKIEKGVSAHYEIEAYASDEADVVVMATHGHSGFAHLILGSTAEKVAQYVKKPVITIRPDEDEFED